MDAVGVLLWGELGKLSDGQTEWYTEKGILFTLKNENIQTARGKYYKIRIPHSITT